MVSCKLDGRLAQLDDQDSRAPGTDCFNRGVRTGTSPMDIHSPETGGCATGSYERKLATLARVPLLIIDDFGLKPLRAPADEDLHDLIAERYEQAATIVTSNLDFSEWDQAFRPTDCWPVPAWTERQQSRKGVNASHGECFIHGDCGIEYCPYAIVDPYRRRTHFRTSRGQARRRDNAASSLTASFRRWRQSQAKKANSLARISTGRRQGSGCRASPTSPPDLATKALSTPGRHRRSPHGSRTAECPLLTPPSAPHAPRGGARSTPHASGRARPRAGAA